MKKYTFVLIAILALAVAAQADLSVKFDFEGATVGGAGPDYVASANQRVTDYMTSVYGSSVTATGAAAWRNSETDPLDFDWPGKTDDDKWLRTYGSQSVTPGAFQISFDLVPIMQACADFYVFTPTTGDDFTVKAYDSTYGDRYAPNASALVDVQSWDFGTGSGSFAMSFGSPVSLLVCSDGGWYDIAIDNLTVTPVPVPGAVMLGMLGLGVAGLKLRKFA
jgi:hypothetical protein